MDTLVNGPATANGLPDDVQSVVYDFVQGDTRAWKTRFTRGPLTEMTLSGCPYLGRLHMPTGARIFLRTVATRRERRTQRLLARALAHTFRP